MSELGLSLDPSNGRNIVGEPVAVTVRTPDGVTVERVSLITTGEDVPGAPNEMIKKDDGTFSASVAVQNRKLTVQAVGDPGKVKSNAESIWPFAVLTLAETTQKEVAADKASLTLVVTELLDGQTLTDIKLVVEGADPIEMTEADNGYHASIERGSADLSVHATAKIDTHEVRSDDVVVKPAGGKEEPSAGDSVVEVGIGEFEPMFAIIVGSVLSLVLVAVLLGCGFIVFAKLGLPSTSERTSKGEIAFGTFGTRYGSLLATLVAVAGVICLLVAAFIGALEARGRLRAKVTLAQPKPLSASGAIRMLETKDGPKPEVEVQAATLEAAVSKALSPIADTLAKYKNMRAMAILAATAVLLLLGSSWAAVRIAEAPDPQVPAVTTAVPSTAPAATTTEPGG